MSTIISSTTNQKAATVHPIWQLPKLFRWTTIHRLYFIIYERLDTHVDVQISCQFWFNMKQSSWRMKILYFQETFKHWKMSNQTKSIGKDSILKSMIYCPKHDRRPGDPFIVLIKFASYLSLISISFSFCDIKLYR